MTESGAASGAISPDTLAAKIKRGEPVSILDVRNRDEFDAWHIDGPRVKTDQIPHVRVLQAEVNNDVEALLAELDIVEPIVVVCAVGDASNYVADVFQDHGIDAVNLADGMAGWANVLLAVDVSASVRQYYRPATGCLSYLVHSNGEGALVDPLQAFTERYLNDATALGVDIINVIDTHIHADHLSGVRAIADREGLTPTLPIGSREREVAFDATFISDNEAITVGDVTIEAVYAPGHTSEMTAFQIGDVLLSGDSLFLESVARPDLEAGAEGAPALARQLFETLHERLLEFPDSTRIAPGHIGPRTQPNTDGSFTERLGTLRADLELLALDEATFVERILSDMPPRPANYEEIIAINKGHSTADSSDQFSLELGPNNCAVA